MNENIQEESIPEKGDKYVIHIDNFDGPLDILWDLIKKAKIDITEVSISDITEQYLEYLKLMEFLNIRVASEFIMMASELLFYKSRALLPSGQIEDEYFVPPLPPELVQKLLEYKKYQQASAALREEYERSSSKFSRDNRLEDVFEKEEYIDVSLFELLKAFAQVMESQKVIVQEEIIFDEILVSDRIDHIKNLFKEKDVVVFIEIFTTRPSRAEIVATFLAILEMAKTGYLKIMQHKVFGNIRLVDTQKKAGPDGEPAGPPDPASTNSAQSPEGGDYQG